MTRYSFCALVGATAIPFQAWANGDHGPAFEQHPHMWGGGLGMVVGAIAMIVVITAIVGVIVLVVRQFGTGAGPERAAIEILEERFARGEIDAQEFQDRRRVLDE